MAHSATSGGRMLPVLGILGAATLWGLFWWPLRRFEEAGVHGLWATLAIYLVALTAASPWLWQRRRLLLSHPRTSLSLALFSGWCNLAFILAVLEGSVVRVLLLFYLSPVWAVLLGRVVLRERIDPASWLVLLAAITGGVVMLYRPEMGALWPLQRADWLALTSGMSFAAANTLIRGAGGMDLMAKMIATLIGCCLVAAAGLVLVGPQPPQLDPALTLGLVVVGVAILIMTLLTQYGVSHLPLHRSSILMLFEIVVGAVSSWLLAGEGIGAREWAGGCLILLAAFFFAWRQREEGEAPLQRGW
ncbi:MAG: DMT family transporter [Gammaproteobacteria bacterium]|nr:MAG: DMT family transporter [Gammaproteobacteria bacterium]